MKILLINTNPVVSRLLGLCTRDEEMVLHEVKHIDTVQQAGYDILFVDDASYDTHTAEILKQSPIQTKVLLSFSSSEAEGFGHVVKKPFLPSQILHILTQVKQAEVLEQEVLEEEIIGTKVLNMDEIEKIKALLDTQDEDTFIDEEDFLQEDVYEERKIKVIKEELMAQGLEILEEDEMVEALSASVEEASQKLDKKLKKVKKRHKKSKISDDDFDDTDLESLVALALSNLNLKKINKLLNGEEVKLKIKLQGRE